MAEDICPNLGCYGDSNAKTPYLDAFAKENIRFNYCYSAAPVCSAARSSLNLGMYGSCAGVGQHRSMNGLPHFVKNIGYYMQQAGYFTVIGKTDFNYPLTEGYDLQIKYNAADTEQFAENIMHAVECAPEDKPIFVIQTSAITHQSQYGYTQDTSKHRSTMPRLQEDEWQDREKLLIPGYHFDSMQSREIWGQYHEKMTSLDRMMGETIQAIKERKIYDDSMILIVGDNGHGIPAGKINRWSEGVHVPMLLHIPKAMEGELHLKEDAYGKYCDRFVTFVDFAATFLSVVNAEILEHMQGKPFLGSKKTTDPVEAFSFGERCDELFENSRSIYEKDYMYLCDFALTPVKRLNTYQITQAPWFVKSMIEKGYENRIRDDDRRALFREMPRINEQLFDLRQDHNQLMDIGKNIDNRNIVLRMRTKMFQYIQLYRDGAMLPEPLAREFLLERDGMCSGSR